MSFYTSCDQFYGPDPDRASDGPPDSPHLALAHGGRRDLQSGHLPAVPHPLQGAVRSGVYPVIRLHWEGVRHHYRQLSTFVHPQVSEDQVLSANVFQVNVTIH